MKRLLICVQAVDLDDPLIGFFVSWLQEASGYFSEITVLALRVGRYSLPAHVHVVPLRSVSSTSRLEAIKTLLKESWRRRRSYDAVFVRGEPHYVLLGAWLWRLLGKKVVFWYAHYRVSCWARRAAFIAHLVVSSTQAASRGIARVVTIGQGIDASRFEFTSHAMPVHWNILIFGRMDASKRVKELVTFFQALDPAVSYQLTLIGRSADEIYEQELDALIQANPHARWLKQNTAYDAVPVIYKNYHIILNATDGSLDKTIVEGALSGLLPVASTPGMKEWLPVGTEWLHWTTERDFTHVLERIAQLSEEEYKATLRAIRAAAETRHTTKAQIAKIAELLERP